MDCFAEGEWKGEARRPEQITDKTMGKLLDDGIPLHSPVRRRGQLGRQPLLRVYIFTQTLLLLSPGIHASS